ncbi:DNA replication ATP-dependent helicase/nuclease DNA2 [Diplonema papillatum]|nr:DNA replication ATP-dependent helicase/nuclease DNA2 [Diplonema papillatum]
MFKPLLLQGGVWRLRRGYGANPPATPLQPCKIIMPPKRKRPATAEALAAPPKAKPKRAKAARPPPRREASMLQFVLPAAAAAAAAAAARPPARCNVIVLSDTEEDGGTSPGAGVHTPRTPGCGRSPPSGDIGAATRITFSHGESVERKSPPDSFPLHEEAAENANLGAVARMTVSQSDQPESVEGKGLRGSFPPENDRSTQLAPSGNLGAVARITVSQKSEQSELVGEGKSPPDHFPPHDAAAENRSTQLPPSSGAEGPPPGSRAPPAETETSNPGANPLQLPPAGSRRVKLRSKQRASPPAAFPPAAAAARRSTAPRSPPPDQAAPPQAGARSQAAAPSPGGAGFGGAARSTAPRSPPPDQATPPQAGARSQAAAPSPGGAGFGGAAPSTAPEAKRGLPAAAATPRLPPGCAVPPGSPRRVPVTSTPGDVGAAVPDKAVPGAGSRASLGEPNPGPVEGVFVSREENHRDLHLQPGLSAEPPRCPLSSRPTEPPVGDLSGGPSRRSVHPAEGIAAREGQLEATTADGNPFVLEEECHPPPPKPSALPLGLGPFHPNARQVATLHPGSGAGHAQVEACLSCDNPFVLAEECHPVAPAPSAPPVGQGPFGPHGRQPAVILLDDAPHSSSLLRASDSASAAQPEHDVNPFELEEEKTATYPTETAPLPMQHRPVSVFPGEAPPPVPVCLNSMSADENPFVSEEEAAPRPGETPQPVPVCLSSMSADENPFVLEEEAAPRLPAGGWPLRDPNEATAHPPTTVLHSATAQNPLPLGGPHSHGASSSSAAVFYPGSAEADARIAMHASHSAHNATVGAVPQTPVVSAPSGAYANNVSVMPHVSQASPYRANGHTFPAYTGLTGVPPNTMVSARLHSECHAFPNNPPPVALCNPHQPAGSLPQRQPCDAGENAALPQNVGKRPHTAVVACDDENGRFRVVCLARAAAAAAVVVCAVGRVAFARRLGSVVRSSGGSCACCSLSLHGPARPADVHCIQLRVHAVLDAVPLDSSSSPSGQALPPRTTYPGFSPNQPLSHPVAGAGSPNHVPSSFANVARPHLDPAPFTPAPSKSFFAANGRSNPTQHPGQPTASTSPTYQTSPPPTFPRQNASSFTPPPRPGVHPNPSAFSTPQPPSPTTPQSPCSDSSPFYFPVVPTGGEASPYGFAAASSSSSSFRRQLHDTVALCSLVADDQQPETDDGDGAVGQVVVSGDGLMIPVLFTGDWRRKGGGADLREGIRLNLVAHDCSAQPGGGAAPGLPLADAAVDRAALEHWGYTGGGCLSAGGGGAVRVSALCVGAGKTRVLAILQPEVTVSATEVSDAIQCERKAFLSGRSKVSKAGISLSALAGVVIHGVVQELLGDAAPDDTRPSTPALPTFTQNRSEIPLFPSKFAGHPAAAGELLREAARGAQDRPNFFPPSKSGPGGGCGPAPGARLRRLAAEGIAQNAFHLRNSGATDASAAEGIEPFFGPVGHCLQALSASYSEDTGGRRSIMVSRSVMVEKEQKVSHRHYGLKGVIDGVLRGCLDGREGQVFALEIKTLQHVPSKGSPVLKTHHKAQLLVYLLLLRALGTRVDIGLLAYIAKGSDRARIVCVEWAKLWPEIAHIVRLRNALAVKLAAGEHPPPDYRNERACKYCSNALSCIALTAAAAEGGEAQPPAVAGGDVVQFVAKILPPQGAESGGPGPDGKAGAKPQTAHAPLQRQSSSGVIPSSVVLESRRAAEQAAKRGSAESVACSCEGRGGRWGGAGSPSCGACENSRAVEMQEGPRAQGGTPNGLPSPHGETRAGAWSGEVGKAPNDHREGAPQPAGKKLSVVALAAAIGRPIAVPKRKEAASEAVDRGEGKRRKCAASAPMPAPGGPRTTDTAHRAASLPSGGCARDPSADQGPRAGSPTCSALSNTNQQLPAAETPTNNRPSCQTLPFLQKISTSLASRSNEVSSLHSVGEPPGAIPRASSAGSEEPDGWGSVFGRSAAVTAYFEQWNRIIDYEEAAERASDKEGYRHKTLLARQRGNLVVFYTAGDGQWLREVVVEGKRPLLSAAQEMPQSDPVARIATAMRLNRPQVSAVQACLRTDSFALLQGLPGSGKTSVIAAVALIQTILFHKTVLVTSGTNSAVDSICLRMLALLPHFQACQNGGTRSRPPEEKYFYRVLPTSVTGTAGTGKTVKDACAPALLPYVFRDVEAFSCIAEVEETLQSVQGRVLCTTALNVHHPAVSRGGDFRFDFVVVDEAGQMLQTVALGALLLGKRFALVGDHEQLPPVIRSKAAISEGAAVSLLEKLTKQHPDATICLDTQYRMPRLVSELANTVMYHGRLITTDESVSLRKLPLLPHRPLSSSPWLGLAMAADPTVLFVDTSALNLGDRRQRRVNTCPAEADLALSLSGQFASSLSGDYSIGVLSPFRPQLEDLQARIKADAQLSQRVEAYTVDQSQGKDLDVCIVTLAKHPGDPVGDLIRSPRRLNVAFTRAKRKLVCFGSFSAVFRAIPEWQSILAWADERHLVIPATG